MRTSELNQLIESPERLQKDQINDLQDLISEYPYFTSAQLLLTKAFFDSENLNFEKQLRLSAAYSGDRKKLHDLLYVRTRTEDEDVIQSADSKSADLQGLEVQSEVENIVEDVGLGHRPSASESEPSELDEAAQADQDFLDAQIMSAAIGNSIVDELETGIQNPEPGVQNPENIESDLSVENAGLGPRTSDSLTEPISDHQSAISEESEASFDESQPHSFSDWLKHYSNQDEDEDVSEAAAKTNPIIQSISDQAKKIQEKAEFYSAAKMAKLSVTESDDLVTETLAKVFEDQGKYEKAIKAYEKLRLKFPEKSVYFAGRIKAVEKKLKS